MGLLDPKALRHWIKARAVNNLMATAKGFFLDARLGPVIQNKIDEVKTEVEEINGNLQYQPIALTEQNNTAITQQWSWAYKKSGITFLNIRVMLNALEPNTDYKIFKCASTPSAAVPINITNSLGDKVDVSIDVEGYVHLYHASGFSTYSWITCQIVF